MVLEAPNWLQNLTYSARLDRGVLADMLGEGVVNLVAGGLKVSQRASGANRSVDVAAGTCYITGDDQAEQGRYRCRNTAVENLLIGAAPGSNSRIDRVIARVYDANVTGTRNEFALEVVAGTVAASPQPPAVPNGAIALADVTVASGQVSVVAANITDRRAPAVPPASAPMYARVWRGGDANIPNATLTEVGFQQETTDLSGLHSTAAEASAVINARVAGLVHAEAMVTWASNLTGTRWLQINRNGFPIAIDVRNSVGATRQTVGVTWLAAAGDTFSVSVSQNSGGTLAVRGGESGQEHSHFALTLWPT
jgi:hypothetical protein